MQKKIPISRSIETGARRKTGGFAALQSMADQPNLDEALKEALESRGVLNRLKAKVRAEIYNLVDHPSRGPHTKLLSNQKLIMNELIREYLLFYDCGDTASVFIPEAGQPEIPFDRAFLASRLGIQEDAITRQNPLLHALVSKACRVGWDADNV